MSSCQKPVTITNTRCYRFHMQIHCSTTTNNINTGPKVRLVCRKSIPIECHLPFKHIFSRRTRVFQRYTYIYYFYIAKLPCNGIVIYMYSISQNLPFSFKNAEDLFFIFPSIETWQIASHSQKPSRGVLKPFLEVLPPFIWFQGGPEAPRFK